MSEVEYLAKLYESAFNKQPQQSMIDQDSEEYFEEITEYYSQQIEEWYFDEEIPYKPTPAVVHLGPYSYLDEKANCDDPVVKRGYNKIHIGNDPNPREDASDGEKSKVARVAYGVKHDHPSWSDAKCFKVAQASVDKLKDRCGDHFTDKRPKGKKGGSKEETKKKAPAKKSTSKAAPKKKMTAANKKKTSKKPGATAKKVTPRKKKKKSS